MRKLALGVMMLAAGQGATVTVEAEGEDAAQALEAIGQLIGDGFGEE